MVDRPLIQHVVDEAREAGIEHFIFVTGRNKGVIEDHFDRQFELEVTLTERGKTSRARAAVGRPAGGRHDELHPPAVAARPRPRGVVRARTGRQRAVRAAAAGRAGAARARLPRADDRRRQRRSTPTPTSSRSRKCRRERVAHVRRGRRRQAQGQGVLDHRDGREADARARRRRTSSSPAATSCSRRSSTCWRSRQRGAGGEIQLTDAMIALAQHAAVLRPEVRGPQLRLRLQDRLPRRQRRLCAGAPRHRAGDSAPKSTRLLGGK